MESKFKEGQIVKRNIASRESWIVTMRYGQLMGRPNNNSHFGDPTWIELDDKLIILAEIRGTDFRRI